MSRIARIVPTTVLTVAALALVAPAAQAKPVTAPSRLRHHERLSPRARPQDVSPIAASIAGRTRNSDTEDHTPSSSRPATCPSRTR